MCLCAQHGSHSQFSSFPSITPTFTSKADASGLAFSAQKPPPVPSTNYNPNIVNGDVYPETTYYQTTAEVLLQLSLILLTPSLSSLPCAISLCRCTSFRLRDLLTMYVCTWQSSATSGFRDLPARVIVHEHSFLVSRLASVFDK